MATKNPKTTSDTSLAEQLVSKHKDLLEAKMSHKAGELVNPRVLGELRKDIARIKTSLNATNQPKEETK